MTKKASRLLSYRDPNFVRFYGQVLNEVEFRNDTDKIVSMCWFQINPPGQTHRKTRISTTIRLKGYNAMAEAMKRDWKRWTWVAIEGRVRAATENKVDFNGKRQHPFTYFEVDRYAIDDINGKREWNVVITQGALKKLRTLATIGRKHLLKEGKDVKLLNIEEVRKVFEMDLGDE